MLLRKEIKSLQNANIKSVIALREKRHRQETGLMIVEGRREILRAWEAGLHVKAIYGSKTFFLRGSADDLFVKAKQGVRNIFEVEDSVFQKICFGHRNEGFLAVCYQPLKTWKDLNFSQTSLIVVLVGVEKPGNIGAILRTCDAAGVNAVVICDAATDLYNPNVVRASLGAIFSLCVIESPSDQVFTFFQEKKIKICATSLKANTEYADVDLRGPLAIAFGSEEEGLGQCWHENADILLRVPMRGRVDSLNVSATAAIVLYEAIRQRK